MNAVAHPEGRFFGFDASAGHIARGKKLIRALKLPNVELSRMTLAKASLRAKADYVTCQGLLAWISRANQAALWKFASRTLKPGGAFAVGYNTLPGWSSVGSTSIGLCDMRRLTWSTRVSSPPGCCVSTIARQGPL